MEENICVKCGSPTRWSSPTENIMGGWLCEDCDPLPYNGKIGKIGKLMEIRNEIMLEPFFMIERKKYINKFKELNSKRSLVLYYLLREKNEEKIARDYLLSKMDLVILSKDNQHNILSEYNKYGLSTKDKYLIHIKNMEDKIL